MQSNVFNTDFQEFIEALNKSEVKYILVGGYSVILHGCKNNWRYGYLGRKNRRQLSGYFKSI
jgi:hypothetical protein